MIPQLPSKSIVRKQSLTAAKEERNSDDSIKTLGSGRGYRRKSALRKASWKKWGLLLNSDYFSNEGALKPTTSVRSKF